MKVPGSPWAARRQLLVLTGLRWGRWRLMWVPVAALLVLSFVLGRWPAAGLALVLWLGFTGQVLVLDTRDAAALVPGHVQRLRELLGAGWLMFSGVIGAACAWLGLGLPAALAWALLLALLAVMVRYPWSWLAGWIVPSFAWWWLPLPSVRTLVAAFHDAVTHQPLLALLATLATGLVVMGWIVDGRSSARRSMRRDGWSGQPAGQEMPAWARAVGAWMRRQGMRAYHLHRRRLCSRAGHAPTARVLLLLGNAHWTGQVTAAFVVLALLALACGLFVGLGVFPAPGIERKHFVGVSLGMMSFALNPLLQMPAGLLRSRREQALLALVPGLPRGPALGRALALRMTLHHGVAWALASALAMAVVGTDSGDASHAVAASVFGLLPFCTLLWRDWSAVSPNGGLRVAIQIAGMAAVVALLFTVLRNGWLPLPGVAAGSVVLTAALLAWRWRRLGQLPGPLPAARRVAA